MTTIVERACTAAAAEHATRIRAINVACGALSGVFPDALRFCFDICTNGTIAEGAVLNIEIIPARWQCRACSAIADASDIPLTPACPRCGSHDMQLSDGRQFQLLSIEID